MRDDLHKKAPIPPRAQALLALALRPADRNHPGRLEAAAARALEQLVTSGLSRATIAALSEGPQGELFGVGQACSPLESEVIQSMAPAPHQMTGAQALEAALQSSAEAYVREARATVIADGTISDVSETIAAMSSALANAAGGVANRTCAGELASDITLEVTLGENLLAPKPPGGR